jgi:uncharacterized protein (TIGR03437 family)
MGERPFLQADLPEVEGRNLKTFGPCPRTGQAGLSVPVAGFTIFGSNFGTGLSNSVVTFNGAPMKTAPVYWYSNSIVAQIPAGTPSGPGSVVVTAHGLASNAATFTVSQPFNCTVP